MAYRFDFDPVHGILRTRFEGVVTDEELVEFYREAVEQVALTNPARGLIDFSACTRLEASVGTVRMLARTPPAMPQPERPRVIVAPGDRTFGMARIFEIEGEITRPNTHVVRTVGEALSILGVLGEPHYGPIESSTRLRGEVSDQSMV